MWTRYHVLATIGPESRVRGWRYLWRPSSWTDDRNMSTRIVISRVSAPKAITKSTSTDPECHVVVAELLCPTLESPITPNGVLVMNPNFRHGIMHIHPFPVDSCPHVDPVIQKFQTCVESTTLRTLVFPSTPTRFAPFSRHEPRHSRRRSQASKHLPFTQGRAAVDAVPIPTLDRDEITRIHQGQSLTGSL